MAHDQHGLVATPVVGSPYFDTTWCSGMTTKQQKKIVFSTER
jgi:hypothetical protein